MTSDFCVGIVIACKSHNIKGEKSDLEIKEYFICQITFVWKKQIQN